MGDQRDAGNAQVHRLHPGTTAAQDVQARLGLVCEGKHVHLEERSPDSFELGISQDNLSRLAGATQVSQPPLDLFVKTDDARCNIVCRESAKTRQESITGRLLLPLQHGKVIGVEDDRHSRSTFELAAANELSQADYFGIGL